MNMKARLKHAFMHPDLYFCLKIKTGIPNSCVDVYSRERKYTRNPNASETRRLLFYVNTQCKARSNRRTSPPAVPSPPIHVSESARPRGREDERSVELPSRAFELDRERAASIALGNFFACTAQPANVSPDVRTAFDNPRLSSSRSKKAARSRHFYFQQF